jgi:hypothetical protein
MSKARLLITAVVVDGRSQSEVARAYGCPQPWVSRLVARYRADEWGRAIAPFNAISLMPTPTGEHAVTELLILAH